MDPPARVEERQTRGSQKALPVTGVRVRIPPRALIVRPATAVDARAIAEVHVASWRAAYRGIVDGHLLDRLDVEQRAERWRAWIGTATIFVAEEHGRLTGFVFTTRDSNEIGALYVAPDRFREGIGSRLLQAAHDAIAAAGYTTATLWVFAANTGARAFYAAHGYAPDGATGEQLGLPTVHLCARLPRRAGPARE
jgi:GNAT superfamily N-acetyltransferase